MRRAGAFTAVLIGLLVAGPSAASADAAYISFDDLAAGTTVNTISGVTFVGGPKVFAPVHVSTESPPNALHTNGSCAGSTCPSGADELEMTFAEPAGRLEMAVGLDDEPAETEFGDSARLRGFDADGALVADSGKIDLGANDYRPITTQVLITSDQPDIARAVLVVGEGGVPRRVNIDSVSVSTEPPFVFPPQVKINSPAAGSEFDHADDVRVSGSAGAGAGILRFCLTASPAPPAAFPADCDDRLDQPGHSSSTFTSLRVGPLVSGTNHITAWVEDKQLNQAHITVDVVLRQNDLRVTEIEATQGIQEFLPVPAPAENDVAHSAPYNGVPLVEGKSTVVRVWTSARLDAAGTPVKGASVYLYGERPDGSLLPGGPIPAIEGPRDIGPTLSFGPLLTNSVWSNPDTSWTFLLPFKWQETHGPVTLRAVVNPASAYPHVNECATCEANNTMRLTGVGFRRPKVVDIYPYMGFYTDSSGKYQVPGTAWQVFARTAEISPFRLEVHPWIGTLNAQGIYNDKSLDQDAQTSALYNLLTESVDIAGYPGFATVAVAKGIGNGLESEHFSWRRFDVRPFAALESNRPLTSVGHEIYHMLGFEHAGRSCDEAAQRGGAEFWPPDDRGLLHGVGTEVSSLWSGARPRRLSLFGLADAAGNPTDRFDLMSYCFDSESNVWISPNSWVRAVARSDSHGRSSSAAAPRARRAIASAGAATLGVSAEIGAGAGQILGVGPGRGRISPPAPGSDVAFRVRNKAGAIVSATPVAVASSHVDLGNHGSDVSEISAVVPARGGDSVELVSDGVVLDTLRRSPATPRVKLVAPGAGLSLAGRASLGVRWRASDPDRGPLLSAVDFSADGGRHWKRLASAIPGRRLTVAPSYLSRSANARLRVSVDDGWNEASAVSGRFTVSGPPPQVTIVSPRPGARLRADETVNLEGSAFDDLSRSLKGGHLRWFDGRRRLGQGGQLSLLGLAPGTHRLRLLAESADGREGAAVVVVKVAAVTPAFTVLEAPPSVPAKARRLTIKAAASVAGRLSVGRFNAPIDRRPRRFRVPVGRGRRGGALKLVLRAGGGTTRATLPVGRGDGRDP